MNYDLELGMLLLLNQTKLSDTTKLAADLCVVNQVTYILSVQFLQVLLMCLQGASECWEQSCIHGKGVQHFTKIKIKFPVTNCPKMFRCLSVCVYNF